MEIERKNNFCKGKANTTEFIIIGAMITGDASRYGLEAVLSHEIPEGDRSTSFASCSLSKSERNIPLMKELIPLKRTS